MNKVELQGFIGINPKVFQTKNGKSVATFSLATNERFKSTNGEWINTTNWHNIVLWDSQFKDIKDFIKTGSQLHIIGRLSSRKYESKTGETKYTYEIIGEKAELVDTDK